MNRDRRGVQLGVLLLLHELAAYGLERIPPATLLLIVFQTLAYIGFIPVLDAYKIASHCLQPSKIIYKKQLERLFYPTYMHADDMHLYYNMVSFLLKGVQLEPFFGTRYFLFLIVTFGMLINMLIVLLSYAAHNVGFGSLNLMRQCAVGFSGVIFALKVLCQEYDPMSRQYGFLRRHRSLLNLSCWSELLLIQLATPNASFVGHLCGILIGIFYTRGFLKDILDLIYPGTYLRSHYRRPRDEQYASRRSRPRNNDEYTGGLSEEEQFIRAMQQSRWEF
uniref:Peptidase S54 rhomboid domain-containing protein n=1 Tax=Trichuris muris TaxID=70415 RepID=A0A5S6QVR6_TRIMR